MPTTPADYHASPRPPTPGAPAPFSQANVAATAVAWAGFAVNALRPTLTAASVLARAAALLRGGGTADRFGMIVNVPSVGAWSQAATGLLGMLDGVRFSVRAAAGVGAVLHAAAMAGAGMMTMLVLGNAASGPPLLPLAALCVVAYAHRVALRAVAAVPRRNR